MGWRLSKEGGVYKAFDPRGVFRAEIEKRPSYARPWLVWRVERNADGSFKQYGGADGFRTFAQAKDFVTNRPGVWGC